MDRKIVGNKTQEADRCSAKMKKEEAISYRLKCRKTANGLSHYVMYGDVEKGASLL